MMRARLLLACEQIGESVSFIIWNETYISPNIQKRVFQCNLSMKDQFGRGFGGFSMKYFGEEVLGVCGF